MNFTGNQRKLYLLALALLVIAIALACTWSLWRKPAADTSGRSVQPTGAVPESTFFPYETPSASPADSAASANVESVRRAGTVDTIVYYQDNYGYLVPVMCSVPEEEGIAKATLGLMVQNTANDMQAARLGLRTVLPEGTSMDLDISDGNARIDLGKEAANLTDAAAESNMITAVVQTLTEFPTVKSVEFLFGGQKISKLPHGTDVSGKFFRSDINLETVSTAADLDGAKPVTLYFPSDSGNVIVPFTRLVYSNADVNTAVLELAKGPTSAGSLESVIPAGCGLEDVKIENGIARIYFTGEFIQLAQNTDGGRMALKALVLTCTQFEGVKGVEIYVDGELYDPGASTLSIPTFVNIADDIVYDYIQTQSAMIFDFE